MDGPENRAIVKVEAVDCNCMVTTRIMDKGIHRISLKLSHENLSQVEIHCGVVRDGAAWNKRHGKAESTEAWFIDSYDGTLLGNGKEAYADAAGTFNKGEILTMELDSDKGTLRFWLDSKPHGPGFSSGVRGRLRWGISAAHLGDRIEIVPTPEDLQPWKAWNGESRDGDDDDDDY